MESDIDWKVVSDEAKRALPLFGVKRQNSQLAKFVGVGAEQVTRWLNGKSIPTKRKQDMLLLLSKFFRDVAHESKKTRCMIDLMRNKGRGLTDFEKEMFK